jgi:predicted GNAT family N-acyltransferase
MNIVKIKKGDKLYKKAFELRYLLFFKDHQLAKEIINDNKEDSSTHIAISNKHELIAYARLTELTDKEFQISQMLVSPNHQHQGYGKELLLEIMKIAKYKGATNITLNARTTAICFYKKYGFQKMSEIYNSQSTGVPHIKMVYRESR